MFKRKGSVFLGWAGQTSGCVWVGVVMCDWSETNIKNIKNITNHSKPLRDNDLRFYVCSMFWVMFYVCINIKPLGGCDRWRVLCCAVVLNG